jgi:MFS family permease
MREGIQGFFSGYKGFGKDAHRLVSVSVLGSVADVPVWFMLTLYLNFLGYSPVELGMVIFLKSIFSVLPLLPAGYICNRLGRRKMIFVGITIYLFGLVLLYRAETLHHFYIGSSVWGLGHAIYIPAFMGFLSEKASGDRRKYLFGFQMFAGMMASAFVVLVVGFLPGALNQFIGISIREGYRVVFLIGACFSLLQFLLLLLIKREEGGDRSDACSTKEKLKSTVPLPKITLLKLCIPMALLGLGAGFVVPFFQVYFQWRFDISIASISILFSLTQFLWAGSFLLMPNLAQKKGSVRSITLVHTAAIFALIAIPVSSNFFFVSAAYVTRMVLMNSTWPIFQSYSLSQMPPEHRSLTISSTDFSFNSMKAITPLIAGYLFEISLELPFLITAVLYIIATISFFSFFRKADDRVRRYGSSGKTAF